VWAKGKKKDIITDRLLINARVRCTFDVCDDGKTAALRRGKAKVNADYHVNKLLPNLVEDYRRILLGQSIFQQDGIFAHTASLHRTS